MPLSDEHLHKNQPFESVTSQKQFFSFFEISSKISTMVFFTFGILTVHKNWKNFLYVFARENSNKSIFWTG